jgi:hypothetical protein
MSLTTMKKPRYWITAAGFLFIIALILRLTSQSTTADNPSDAEVHNSQAANSNASISVNEPGTSRSDQEEVPTPPAQKQQSMAPEPDPLADALASYAATTKVMFDAGTAGYGSSREQHIELGRERQTCDSIIEPRINAAIARKYRRRPSFKEFPAGLDYVLDTIHREPPSCPRCLDINYEIYAPKEIINRYLPYDPFRLGLSCRVKISLARYERNDEAFIENIAQNDCFEGLSDT